MDTLVRLKPYRVQSTGTIHLNQLCLAPSGSYYYEFINYDTGIITLIPKNYYENTLQQDKK